MAGRSTKATGTAPKSAPESNGTKDRAPKVASIDFGALGEPEEIETESIVHTRQTKLDRSPVLGWLQDSWDNDTGKRQVLPSQEQADEFVKLLRNGVNRLGFGLRVRTVPQDNGTVAVEYAAVERRARKSAEAE